MLREYVSTLTPEQLASLPEDCSRALRDFDVPTAAVTVLHAEMRYAGAPEVAALLHEIGHTYAAASVRLNKITGEPLLPSAQ